MKKFFENKYWIIFWRIVRIPLGVILILFIGLVIYRIPAVLEKKKTEEAVLRIHAQKITLDDVMGANLPPEPNQELNDSTIEGIDANQNGIRDDVELAIFKEYPDSAKTRAVLLQYAFVLQMQTNQSIINTNTVTEIITELSRADSCVADVLVPRKSPESSRNNADMEKIDAFIKFIENKQLNTDTRKKADQDFYKNLRSYGESTNEICDVDILKLPN